MANSGKVRGRNCHPRRAQVRAEKRADAEARRAETAARRTADLEAQLVTLAEQLQGPLSGQDLAPPSRPRRAPKPIDRLP